MASGTTNRCHANRTTKLYCRDTPVRRTSNKATKVRLAVVMSGTGVIGNAICRRMPSDEYQVLANGTSASSAARTMDEISLPAFSAAVLDIADDAVVRDFGKGIRVVAPIQFSSSQPRVLSFRSTSTGNVLSAEQQLYCRVTLGTWT